jgi:isoquinoline 1-oxidoreductase alpha subunit
MLSGIIRVCHFACWFSGFLEMGPGGYSAMDISGGQPLAPCLPATTGRVMELQINGQTVQVDADPAMPLLWVLRDLLNMTGTKFGCGVAACGACTVRVDGQAVRACVTPVATLAGRRIQTIEALGTPARPHALQRAWIAEQVPQCGYCQSGMLMAAAALLEKTPKPTDADIDAAMTNICRCGTYQRVRLAIKRAAGMGVARAPVKKRS